MVILAKGATNSATIFLSKNMMITRRKWHKESWLVVYYCYALLLATSSVHAGKKNSCVLPCRNKGMCAIHGRTRQLSSQPWPFGLPPRLLLQGAGGGGGGGRQYCKCQKGFIGPLCEISLVLCEHKDQQCANGSFCQRDIDGIHNEVYYHCECKKSKSDLSFDYSDKLCEHASTVFCTSSEDDKNSPTKTSRQSLGKSAGGSFCVNGGTCLEQSTPSSSSSSPSEEEKNTKNTHHFGCQCPPGYRGNHCEVVEFPDTTEKKTLQSVLAQHQTTRTAGGWVRSFFMILLFILGSMLLGLMALIRHGNRDKKPNRKMKTTAQDRARIPDIKPESEIELS